MARMRCTASIVASVPELVKRHRGRPKRLPSSSATMMASSVGWAKWVPGPTRRVHSLDDRRVGVPGQARTVAAVHVDVFGPVDVVDLRAGAVADPDRLGACDLPARGHPPGEGADRTFAQLPGPGLAVDENLLLLGDDGVQPLVDLLAGRARGLGQLDCHCYLSVRAAPVSVRRRRQHWRCANVHGFLVNSSVEPRLTRWGGERSPEPRNRF